MKEFQIVLAGNPNCGKSTIFNQLTGARQHVGNYPGVTVEKKEGKCRIGGRTFKVVDLPGAYSMDAHSEDEEAARQYLLENRDSGMVLVNVVDACNLERSLFLTLQLRELNVPMVLVLNMCDLARQRGIEFRKGEISEWLRLPVLECVGFTGEGVREMTEKVVSVVSELENGMVPEDVPQWLKDLSLKGELPRTLPEGFASESASPAPKADAERSETENAALYYEAVSRILPQMISTAKAAGPVKTSFLDRLFLHRFLGLPLFFLMLYLIFQLTFTVGEYPMGWIESGVEALSEKVGSFWAEDQESLLKSLILDGIIAGVGGVVIFLPNIVLLFLAISILEDSGYMARAAVVMDRFMAKVGLHGKSFIPMMVGFGCTVPGIMATRTLDNRRERLATIFILPLMSCGARMPIYALLIPAFFPQAWHGNVLFLVYVIGILLAILLAKLLRVSILRGEPVPFVMELPAWHVPTLRTVGVKTLERGWIYLKKAGTIILGLSIILWALATFPQFPNAEAEKIAASTAAELANDPEVSEDAVAAAQEERVAEAALEYSYSGRIGKVIEPLMTPMGMDWRVGTAFLGAFAAKEVFVAQMAIVYQGGDVEDEEAGEENVLKLGQKLKTQYASVNGEVSESRSMLVGWCFLLFSLIAAPCCATVGVVVREAGWKWAVGQYVGLTAIAWGICVAVYQIGTMCGM
ncbi:MAG: ferrous iron transport protein B [Thermoguttaceae bacterium]|nr:ferrous iron transport protein B [Thermoguttaceae bacterium]